MKRRDKWILVGCLIVVFAAIGYLAIWVIRDLDRMEARRPLLLYETDHQTLLEACRELSKQVAVGQLEPGMYGRTDKRIIRQFPKIILDLEPLEVFIGEDGYVQIMMSCVTFYGVSAFPVNYSGSRSNARNIDVELIDGLYYFDEDYVRHPEHKKEVEELLRERNAQNVTKE